MLMLIKMPSIERMNLPMPEPWSTVPAAWADQSTNYSIFNICIQYMLSIHYHCGHSKDENSDLVKLSTMENSASALPSNLPPQNQGGQRTALIALPLLQWHWWPLPLWSQRVNHNQSEKESLRRAKGRPLSWVTDINAWVNFHTKFCCTWFGPRVFCWSKEVAFKAFVKFNYRAAWSRLSMEYRNWKLNLRAPTGKHVFPKGFPIWK